MEGESDTSSELYEFDLTTDININIYPPKVGAGGGGAVMERAAAHHTALSEEAYQCARSNAVSCGTCPQCFAASRASGSSRCNCLPESGQAVWQRGLLHHITACTTCM